ncbi:MAG: hypothetical protein HPY57_14955 [Ignavibacteria bacterium]|nr:hypothetical protein [Ignavibacteria bacterium]
MKLWVINNTKFGYKNNSKEWLKNMVDYFDNQFIPFLKKNAKPGDKIIHLGNILNTTETVNISTLLTVRELFIRMSYVTPVYLIDGYNEKNGVSKLFINGLAPFFVYNINNVEELYGVKFIPNKNPLEHITSNDRIVFINNRIDTELLKKFPDILFLCGYSDDRKEDANVIHVGAPYQFDKTSSDKGFYVVDIETKKYKFIKNNYSPIYNTITITDISQIDDIDVDFVNKNFVNIVIDKSLIDDKKIKIDMLLSKYNFKSITYTNDVENVEVVDNNTLNIEEIIREKIKKSDNQELLSEFENIVKIFKEKY